jgi:hypothetical protein
MFDQFPVSAEEEKRDYFERKPRELMFISPKIHKPATIKISKPLVSMFLKKLTFTV